VGVRLAGQVSMTGTTLRPIAVEQVAIDLLRPDPANPRRISEEELDSLERSLRQYRRWSPVSGYSAARGAVLLVAFARPYS
jgi:hypothetical protein